MAKETNLGNTKKGKVKQTKQWKGKANQTSEKKSKTTGGGQQSKGKQNKAYINKIKTIL